VLRLEAEPGEVRLAALLFLPLQRPPGAAQQLVAPAVLERLVPGGGHRAVRPRLRGVGRDLPRQAAALVVVVGHQVEQHALDEIAEPAALAVGAFEVAVEEAEGELLLQLVGGVRVAERPEQVAVDRPAVAVPGGPAGGAAALAGVAVRLQDLGQEGVDLVETRIAIATVHYWVLLNRPICPAASLLGFQLLELPLGLLVGGQLATLL